MVAKAETRLTSEENLSTLQPAEVKLTLVTVLQSEVGCCDSEQENYKAGASFHYHLMEMNNALPTNECLHLSCAFSLPTFHSFIGVISKSPV